MASTCPLFSVHLTWWVFWSAVQIILPALMHLLTSFCCTSKPKQNNLIYCKLGTTTRALATGQVSSACFCCKEESAWSHSWLNAITVGVHRIIYFVIYKQYIAVNIWLWGDDSAEVVQVQAALTRRINAYFGQAGLGTPVTLAFPRLSTSLCRW